MVRIPAHNRIRRTVPVEFELPDHKLNPAVVSIDAVAPFGCEVVKGIFINQYGVVSLAQRSSNVSDGEIVGVGGKVAEGVGMTGNERFIVNGAIRP